MTTTTERRGSGDWAVAWGSCSSGPTSNLRLPMRWHRPPGGQLSRASPPVAIPEGSYFAELPAEAISANPRQPRTVFDEDAMQELVDSISEVGLLQPVVVRPLGRGASSW